MATSTCTAQIIPFPTRMAAADAVLQPAPDSALSESPQERLARALASLDAALTEQRTAMAGWRDALDQLRKSTNGLGLSIQRYQRTLGKLGDDVAALNTQAVRLERWADGALTRRD